jgi:hypothetical protein
LLFSYEHYIGLVGIALSFIVVFIKPIASKLITGVLLILWTFSFAAFTAIIQYHRIGFSVEGSGLDIKIQPYCLLLLVLFIVLNFDFVKSILRRRTQKNPGRTETAKMNNSPNLWNSYVIRNILVNNPFGITELCNLESIKGKFFSSAEYPKIEQLIENGNIEEIKTLPGYTPNMDFPREYLDIMTFKDQNMKEYIVTVYDSDELSQDPQVIKIFPFKTNEV